MKTSPNRIAARLMAWAVLTSATAPHAQMLFTKITNSPVVLDAARSLAASWVDFDGDGNLDLFVTNADGSNLLYRNDGHGVFTKITTGPIVNAGLNSFAASWVDMNNDGRLDLYIAKDGGPSLLFLQQADGSFTQETYPMATISGAAWGDYDGDGWVDLLCADDSAGMLWRNDGHGGLTKVANKPINIPGVGVATWADYDNDGDLDVLVTAGAFRAGTRTVLYRNDGRGSSLPSLTAPSRS